MYESETQNRHWTAIPDKANIMKHLAIYIMSNREEEAFHERQKPLRLAKVTAQRPSWTGYSTGTNKAM
jgi:hypothetical protein